MATRSDIRTGVKNKLERSPSNIDATIDEYIDMAVELFSNTLTAVQDEAEYQYTISQSDVDNNVESYTLPTDTKVVMDATYVNTSGSEDVFYDIRLISPLDINSVRKFGLEGFESAAAGERFDFNIQTPTFLPSGVRSRFDGARRVNRKGRPRVAARIADKLHVHPRPGDPEVGDIIRIMVQLKPTALTGDSDTNTITNNYPQTLEAYVTALTQYYAFNNYPAGDRWMQQASLMLSSFARQDEINKLVNIPLGFSRG